MARNKFIGALLHNKQTGQAQVTLINPTGRRRTYELGPYGSYESQLKHEQLTRQWKRNGRELPGDDAMAALAGSKPAEQLKALAAAWPGLLAATRGAIMFLAGLDNALNDVLLEKRKLPS
jgi:hypothetical protein